MHTIYHLAPLYRSQRKRNAKKFKMNFRRLHRRLFVRQIICHRWGSAACHAKHYQSLKEVLKSANSVATLLHFIEGTFNFSSTGETLLTLIHDQTFLTGFNKQDLPVRLRLSIVQVRFRWRRQQSNEIKNRILVSSENIHISNEEQQQKYLALTP